MKVAIDGPAGSGKSTVAHALAQRLGLTLLDTGAMYRSVTLACQERGVDMGDDDAVGAVAREVRIEFATDETGEQRVLLDGRDVSVAIRTPEVDAAVSAVSAIPAVREAMVAEQRRMGAEGDVVAEGRDIGTVVFPDAEVKVFLTADPAARAHRRALQRSVEDPEEERRILTDLLRRDKADSTRQTAPLVAAEDAHHMDSSSMTVEQEVEQIVALVQRARAAKDAGASEQPSGPQPAKDEPKPAEPKPAGPKADILQAAEAKGVEPQAEDTQPLKVEARKVKPAEPEGAEPEIAVPEVAGSQVAEPQAMGTKAAKAQKAQDKAPQGGRMRVFAHHEPDEFYDAAVRDFPLSARALLGTTIWVCGILSKTLWHWKLEGAEHLWDAEGGQVVVMNHVSMLDPVIIVVSDWFHGRRMRPIYKSEFDKHDIVRWFFARVGAIPVERGTADIKAVRRAQRALQRGEDVLVFPEGTRIYSDDQEVTIHGGFALMAQLAKAPVLPVAIVGARDGAPGGNKPLRPGRVWMRAGEPLTFDQIEEKGRKKRAKAMEKLAMERVYALRDALRKEHPGKM